MTNDIVIIGAPRSGTNMLRDVLTALPGYSTWPCDEINLTWRKGNRTADSDELTRDQADPRIQDYVAQQFGRIRVGDGTVVEKTCANSLRVGFVDELLPTARFVFIVRDGFDAAASAMERWHAPFDLRYTLAKARWMPYSDAPFYGLKFLSNRLRRAMRPHADGAAPSSWWGPKPVDWRRLADTRPLDEVAMTQWQRCVDSAMNELHALPASRVHQVRYEEFVSNPEAGLRGLLRFLGDEGRFDPQAVAGVTSSSIGKGRQSLSESARLRLWALAGSTMSRAGYDA